MRGGSQLNPVVILTEVWGLDGRTLSLSAYLALGRSEDRFQAEKREPVGEARPG